jgi:5-methylcytosine-specific restriction protein A
VSGGWADSNRRAELPPNWPALRAACAKRAGGRCQWRLKSGARCPRPGTDADHYGDKDDHTKLRWLCDAHHKLHTAAQARLAKAVRKAATRRPEERHPSSLR